MRDANEFKTNAEKHKIDYWPIQACSICQTVIGYIILEGEPFFDSSCECTQSTRNISLKDSSWQEIADHFNGITNRMKILQNHKFWHFDLPDFSIPGEAISNQSYHSQVCRCPCHTNADYKHVEPCCGNNRISFLDINIK